MPHPRPVFGMHDRIYYDDGSVYERRRVQAPADAPFGANVGMEWVEVEPLPRTARATEATPALGGRADG